jgi:galactose mutarotase-like enzyme
VLEAPLLYHVNLGDWVEHVESDATAVVPRDEDAAPHDPTCMPDRADAPERVWEHMGATWARAGGSGIEVTVRSSLPRLWQWIEPSLGALGLEPANCSVLGRAHDRAEGRLPVLAPGETRETWLSITAKETR